jgi:prefoldin subunit 5
MRLNTLNREIQELQEKLNTIKKSQIEPLITQKKNILTKIKEIEKFHEEVMVNKDRGHAAMTVQQSSRDLEFF